jgi:uncharacterized protein (TIGR00270 family)
MIAGNPYGGLMGTCELCGSDKVSTIRTKASGARVDACNRCVERLGLERPAPKPIIQHKTKNPMPKKNNIMAKGEKELADDFHIRIRNARSEKGWDQREFARRMNERINTVQRIENGNRPTDTLIGKIEKVLDIDLMVENTTDNTRQLGTTSRSMTIGDVYEEMLKRRD